MKNAMKCLFLCATLLSTSGYALTQQEAAELLPVKITAVDAPKKNGMYSTIMKLHYQIDNNGEKDIDAIKADLVILDIDGSEFQVMGSRSVSIPSGKSATTTFNHGYDESRFEDKKLQKLGTKMGAKLKVYEIIYADGSAENVTQ